MLPALPAARPTRLPWLLLLLLLPLSVGAAVTGGRSVYALSTRHAQAEREAAESEARLVEQLALRESMERRLRVLEQEAARLTLERNTLQAQLEVRAAKPPRAVAKPAKGKRSAAAQKTTRKAAGSRGLRGATAAR